MRQFRMFRIWAVLVLTMATPVWADGDDTPEPGTSSKLIALDQVARVVGPAVPVTGQSGPLQAVQFAVADPDQFYADWDEQHDPAQQRITSVSTVKRGEKIYLMALLRGCQPATNGKCDVRSTLTVHDPSGEEYDFQRDQVAWDKPPREEGELVTSGHWMALTPATEDSVGIWKIDLQLSDRISGNKIDLTLPITVQ